MHLFIEKRMRGGISYIAKRYSKANNKYMKCYDSSKESEYIIQVNTNLYGWAMSQYLPYIGFKWLNQKEVSDFCLNSISENSVIGCCQNIVLILQMNMEKKLVEFIN